jgi:hypothetical protein
MSEFFVTSEHYTDEASFSDNRRKDSGPFLLVELNPTEVVDGLRTGGYIADDVRSAGKMRESCPECNVHLQLVLRQKGVKRSYIFCEQCERCFDAVYPNGVSVFAVMF